MWLGQSVEQVMNLPCFAFPRGPHNRTIVVPFKALPSRVVLRAASCCAVEHCSQSWPPHPLRSLSTRMTGWECCECTSMQKQSRSLCPHMTASCCRTAGGNLAAKQDTLQNAKLSERKRLCVVLQGCRRSMCC
jgi:hypothetical protein